MQIIQSIQNRIYNIRGERVMIDRDLAELYEIETKRLVEAVKRNLKRFPADFMFQLTRVEFENLRSQFATSSLESPVSKIVTVNWGGTRYMPYAFTELGVAMLSSVLNSDKAISMNIAIMRAFVAIRKATMETTELKAQLNEIREVLGQHDGQLNHIYEVLENLLDEKAAQRKWEDRERIGFK